jgi:hypothetical protein
MRKTFLFSMLILLLIGCNKDKFNTKPSLKYKSVNTTLLQPGQIITFTLSFTDAEGDLTDTLSVIKFDPVCVASRFTDAYPLPEFPTTKNQEGDILVTYGYNVTNYPPIQAPQCFNRNDTCVFKFVLKDKAQNRSDTAVSETIVITQ